METTLSEALDKYCERRQHQLNSIDDACFAGGDMMMISELRNRQITEKLPILNGWVETLTRVMEDLIKTIKDVERTMANEDERMVNAGVPLRSNDETQEPVRRHKSSNKITTKNAENSHSIPCNSPAARARLLLPRDQMNMNYRDCDVTAATATEEKDVNSIGFCRNLLKKVFKKGKCDERAARPDGGCGNGRISNVEFVYVDKSLCCMSTIINEKVTNTTQMTNADRVYADFKENCTDRMQTLQHVTTALQSSLRQQEESSAQQLQQIEQLRAQIKKLKKYRRTNRMLEANIKSICAENAHLLVEAKKIEKTLRLLRKRQPDNDHQTTQ